MKRTDLPHDQSRLMKPIIFLPILILISMPSLLHSDEPLDSANAYIRRGSEHFFANRIAESIDDFDKAAELDPGIAPELWQRGISYYYADEFKKGREQFESHKTVNPNDVENPAWHLLCTARQLDSLEKAREFLIKVDTSEDTREPMKEIYALYAGSSTPEAVLKRAEEVGTNSARMYAHLYVALYHEVTKDEAKAKDHMLKAAVVKLGRPSYMQEVARVHILQRKWDK